VWHNLSSHTQTTLEKQPEPKKHTNLKPVVWCAVFRAQRSHKDKQRNTALQKISTLRALGRA
jgi:hypothetical protein